MRTGYWPLEGFSFVAGKATSPKACDFHFEAPIKCPPEGLAISGTSRLEFVAPNNADGFCALGPADFDSLAEAPAPPLLGSNYKSTGISVVVGHTYAFRVGGGKFYGKLHVLKSVGDACEGTVQFEYVLQQDGSRKLK